MNYFIKRTTLSVLLMFALANTCQIFAQTWVGFSKSTPADAEATVNTSSTTVVQFQVETPGMYQEDIIEGSTTYQRLSVGAASRTTETGHPELPVITKMVAIPECSNVSISTAVGSANTFTRTVF